MAELKVACPKCGQKVSGDETFFGTSVQCPICSSKIEFPAAPGAGSDPSGGFDNLPTANDGAAPGGNPPAAPPHSVPAPPSAVPPPPGSQPAPPTQQPPQQQPYPQQPLPGHGALPQGGPLPGSGSPLPPGTPVSAPAPQAPSQSPYGMPQADPAPPAAPVPPAQPSGPQPAQPPAQPAPSQSEDSEAKPGPLPLLTLISGIVSFVTFWCFGSILFGPAAIIMGHIALIRMNSEEGGDQGKGKVLTGLILGYVSLVLMLIAAVVIAKFAPSLIQQGEENASLLNSLMPLVG